MCHSAEGGLEINARLRDLLPDLINNILDLRKMNMLSRHLQVLGNGLLSYYINQVMM